MNKVSILLLGLALTLVTGQCDNPLLDELSLTAQPGTPATPATPTGTLAYCKTVGTICCLQSDITSLGDTIQTKLDSLATAVGLRDKNILEARAALALVSANLTAFKTATTAATTNLAAMILAPVNDADTVKSHSEKFSGYVTSVITKYSDIRTAFGTYQTARQTCVVAIMKAQAQVYCLACSADPEGNGVDSSGNINFAPATINALRTACYSYLSTSADQSVILKLSTQIDNIDAMTAALVLIADNNNAGVAAYIAATASAATPASTPTKVPDTCSDAACIWITTVLFPVTGEVDASFLALGGVEDTSRRVLEEARLLQATWTPIESGVDVIFLKDPADLGNPVDSMSAVIRNGVISCIAAVFVTLLV